ncbi:MAG TPA: ATP-binding cassette domain-containing protein [Propionibacteriaceae bacterium]|nr:ATP-binding cassette domain-containing protein [Propionibacteriaceae bacterium]
MAASAATPVLQMEGISKRFGAVSALTDVYFEVFNDEVVALVGDNGAGKSTLIKVIAGVGANDEGVIRFEGKEVTITKPLDATALGIATVYQDLALCDNLDVVANLFLGREDTRTALLDEVTMEKRATELLRSLAAKIPSVRIPVASLSGGQRQTVAISRSLVGEPKVVILDEPTAALGVAQTAQVLDLIERLKQRGHAVILITHNLADAFAVCDRIVVLRLGRNAGEFQVGEVSQEEIVATITGAKDNIVAQRAARHTSADAAGSRTELEPTTSGDGQQEVER